MKSSELTLAYINVGKAPAKRVIATLDRLEVDAFGMAECSDRADIYREAAERYWMHAPMDKPGGRATPIGWRRGGRFVDVRPFSAQLTPPGLPLGPGTGPDDGKAKHLVGVRLHDTLSHRNIVPGTLHLYAGQRWDGQDGNRRANVSTTMLTASMHRQSRRAGIPFLLTDSNAGHASPTWSRVLDRHPRWTTNHLALEPVTTHGRDWDPDAIAWRQDRRIEVVDQGVVDVGSDHGLLWVRYRLMHRPAS